MSMFTKSKEENTLLVENMHSWMKGALQDIKEELNTNWRKKRSEILGMKSMMSQEQSSALGITHRMDQGQNIEPEDKLDELEQSNKQKMN